MFDHLFDLVKQNAGDAIINNPVIPNAKNEDAISQTTSSIFNTLKQQATSGNLQNIMELFKQHSGISTTNPVMNSINDNLTNDLMQKFGIDNAQAGNIATSLIPPVMDKLVTKTNDPNDASLNMDDILSSIGGSGGLGNMAKNIFG